MEKDIIGKTGKITNSEEDVEAAADETPRVPILESAGSILRGSFGKFHQLRALANRLDFSEHLSRDCAR